MVTVETQPLIRDKDIEEKVAMVSVENTTVVDNQTVDKEVIRLTNDESVFTEAEMAALQANIETTNKLTCSGFCSHNVEAYLDGKFDWIWVAWGKWKDNEKPVKESVAEFNPKIDKDETVGHQLESWKSWYDSLKHLAMAKRAFEMEAEARDIAKAKEENNDHHLYTKQLPDGFTVEWEDERSDKHDHNDHSYAAPPTPSFDIPPDEPKTYEVTRPLSYDHFEKRFENFAEEIDSDSSSESELEFDLTAFIRARA